MAVQADQKYEATVEAASFTTSNEKGTLGLFINFKTADGPVDRTWYVTENTVDRLKENLAEVFGVTVSQLQDESFLVGGVNEFLRGKPCAITTEYRKDSNGNVYKDANGRAYVTVQWLNPSRAGRKAEGQSIKKLAGLFGGGSGGSHSEEPPPVDWGPDGGTPF